MSRSATPIPKRDAQLKCRRDRYPNQIGHLSHRDPTVLVPDGHDHPKDRGPDNHNVQCGQRQASQAKLNRCEDQIGEEIDGEWQRHKPRHFLANGLNEYKSERDKDDWIEDLPD